MQPPTTASTEAMGGAPGGKRLTLRFPPATLLLSSRESRHLPAQKTIHKEAKQPPLKGRLCTRVAAPSSRKSRPQPPLTTTCKRAKTPASPAQLTWQGRRGSMGQSWLFLESGGFSKGACFFASADAGVSDGKGRRPFTPPGALAPGPFLRLRWGWC